MLSHDTMRFGFFVLLLCMDFVILYTIMCALKDIRRTFKLLNDQANRIREDNAVNGSH